MRKLLWLIPLLCSLALAQGVGGKGGIGGTAGFGGGVSSGGSVAFDAVGPSSSGSQVQSGDITWTTFTNTWTHVVASGGSLVVGCSYGAGSSAHATMAATYNGTSMGAGTTETITGFIGFVQLWTMLSPTSGSHSVVVTATYVSGTKASGDYTLCGSVSFTNVTGFGTPVIAMNSSGTSTSISSGPVTSAAGHMVVDAACTGTSITSSTQTIRWHATKTGGGDDIDAGGQSTAAGASSVTMGYTVAADVWAIVAVDVQ